MNILIIGYYRFEDGYYAYGKYFNQYFKSVSFFPLIECRDLSKINQTTINDIETVISGESLSNNVYSKYLINENCPKNIVIIAHNNDMLATLKIDNIMVIQHIQLLKQKYNFKLIQINWDPIINNTNNKIIKCFDKSFCSDPSLLKLYKNVIFFQSGFCPNTSFFKEDNDYKCDVSFIGTNLYENPMYPNKLLNRKLIIDLLYSDKSIKLNIYGPKFLGDKYPDSYTGSIDYNNCYKIFSNSKINLNISPLVNVNTNDKLYYSERLPQILGCDGIMLSNNDLTPMLIPNEHYLYINHINQLLPCIHSFLKNTSLQEKIKKNVINIKNNFNYENIIRDLCKEL